MAGRGHQGGHSASQDPIDGTPIIALDNRFLRRGTEGEASVPVLVAKVRKLNLLFAHVVPNKGGSHREVIAQLVKDLQKCGFHGKVVLKGDQEPAIEDLLREVARHRGDAETVLEFSPVRDSSGNGGAEKGVQTLECLVRTHLMN